MDFYNAFEDKLHSAVAVLNELPALDNNPRILHLGRLLRNVVSSLQALLADIEAGCSWSEMGFFGEGEVSEMVDDFNVEISSLKSLIQNAKMLEI